MITCALCKREWPRSQSVEIRSGYFACGEPRRCHQYTSTTAAQRLTRRVRRYKSTGPASARIPTPDDH